MFRQVRGLPGLVDSQERRRSRRSSFSRMGRLQGDFGVHPCLIIDISEDGARLCAEQISPPDQFVLSVTTQAGEQRKTCRVVWRLEHELGVQFLD